jgi:putative ABC transport system ATP-binding protein
MSLKIDQLSKSFFQGTTRITALDQVSFTVEKGDSFAIIGPSGSGKTTLLTLMAGLESPTSGHIFFDKTDITLLSEKERTEFRAKNIGIVFQQFHLMPHLTALENVSLPLEITGAENIQDRATEALVRVGLEHRVNHLPKQLSGGESQRVAMARAMVHRPPFIFADEPSGNLDTENGEKVMKLLFDLIGKEKSTLVLITHDLNLASRCHRQIHLHGGRLQ